VFTTEEEKLMADHIRVLMQRSTKVGNLQKRLLLERILVVLLKSRLWAGPRCLF